MAKVTPDELQALAAFQRQRDECGLKLGVADYEHTKLRAQLIRRIDESLGLEQRTLAEILARHGVDPARHRVDLASGEIVGG